MFRTYLLSTTALAALLIAGIVLFTHRVDPYWLYHLQGARDDEASFDLILHLRLHKPHAIRAFKPQHLVIGSSRLAAVPPRVLGERSYNASLTHISMHEIRRMTEHAQAVQPLQSVYLGIDYQMFEQGHAAPQVYGQAYRDALNYLRGLPGNFTLTDQDLRRRYTTRIQRAIGRAFAGASRADVEAALKGQ